MDRRSGAIQQVGEMVRSLVQGLSAALVSGDRSAVLQAGRRAAVLDELADGLHREAVAGVPSLDADRRLFMLTVADLARDFFRPLDELGRWASSDLGDFAETRTWLAELLCAFLEEMDGAVVLSSARRVPLYEARDLPRLSAKVMDGLTVSPSATSVAAALSALRALEAMDGLFELLGRWRYEVARPSPGRASSSH